jgi:hypothetical protein
MILADLLDRRIGHDEQHDIGEGDRLGDGAGLGEGAGRGNEVVQLRGMARGKHHRVPGLGEQRAERAALASGADRGDLERRAARRALRECGDR